MVRKTAKADNRRHTRRSTRPSASVRKARATPSDSAMPTTRSGTKQPSDPSWGPNPSEKVTLVVRLPNGEKKSVGTAFVRGDSGAGGHLVRTLHGHELKGKPTEDLVVIWKVLIEDGKDMQYPYQFKTSDSVPNTLGDMESNAFYCWDVNMMQPSGGGASTPSTPAAKPSSAQTPAATKNPSTKKVKQNTARKAKAKKLTQLVSLSDDDGDEIHKGALHSNVKTTTSTGKAKVVRLSDPKKGNSANPIVTPAKPPLNPGASSGGGASQLQTPETAVSAPPKALTMAEGTAGNAIDAGSGGQSQLAYQTQVAEAIMEAGSSAPMEVVFPEQPGGEEEGSDDDEVQFVGSKALASEAEVDLFDKGDELPPDDVDDSMLDSSFDMNDYTYDTYVVDIDLIKPPDDSVRELDLTHKKEVEQQIELYGILGSVGNLSVTIIGTKKPGDDWFEGNRIVVDCTLVDGLHRLNVYLDQRKTNEKLQDVCHRLSVSFWRRRDGLPMTMSQVISIGNALNDTVAAARVMSFRDKLYSIHSFMKTIEKETKVDFKKVTRTMLRGALLKRKVIGTSNPKNMLRFADMGLRMFTDEDFMSRMKEMCFKYPELGITHFSSDRFFNLKGDRMNFALEALQEHYDVRRASKGTAMGRFQDMRLHFFRCCEQAYNLFEEVAKTKNIGLHTVFKTEVVIGSLVVPVRDYVARNTARLERAATAAMWEGNISKRLTNLKKRLGTTFRMDFQKPNPSPVPPAPVPVPTTQGQSAVQGSNSSLPARASKKKALGHLKDGGATGMVSAGSTLGKRKRKVRKTKKPADEDSEDEEDAEELLFESVDADAKRQRTDDVPDFVINILKQKRGRELRHFLRKNKLLLFSDDEGGEDEDRNDPNKKKFDDEVPQILPEGLVKAEEDTNVGDLSWLKYVSMLPSRWPTATADGVKGMYAWMDRIHLPKEHRCHLLGPNDMRGVHHAVFWHGAFQELLSEWNRERKASEEAAPVLSDAEANSLWERAVEEDYYAMVYFAKKTSELKERGFCVLEGFGTDEGMRSRLHAMSDLMDGDVSEKLLGFFEEYFNRQQDLREAENQEFWNPIFNAGEAADEADRLSGSTRYMTTRRGIADEMERTTENHWVVKRRALLDARMGQICVCLGLEDNRVAVHKMFAPKTGGRVLCTGRGCPRQKLHTDFQTLTIPEKLNEKNPGYFMIASGKYSFPLWVCERSHKHFATTNAELEAVSGGYATRKFLIPPLSIFIGRGDVSHAGAGSRDAIMAQNFLFRYHIYMVPEDYKLPDAVQLQSSFRPRFVEDEDLIRKDKSGTKGTILLPGVGDNEEGSADDRVSQEPLEDDEDPQNESDGEYDPNEDGNDNADDAIYTQEEGEKGDEDMEEDN